MSGGMGVDRTVMICQTQFFRRLLISFRAHNCEVYTDQIDTIIRIFIFFCDSILLLLISILMYICNFIKLFIIVPHL